MMFYNTVVLLSVLMGVSVSCIVFAQSNLSEMRNNALAAVNKLSGSTIDKASVYDGIEALFLFAQQSKQSVEQVKQDATGVVLLNNDKEAENGRLQNENQVLKQRLAELEEMVQAAKVKQELAERRLVAKEQECEQLISKEQLLVSQQQKSKIEVDAQIKNIEELMKGAGISTEELQP